jgi:short-subunit dehydrogenase
MKYTLLTGASSGIGYELSKILASHHHNLILVARSADKLDQLKSELPSDIDVIVYPLDLTDEDKTDVFLSWLDDGNYQIDLLVNNAGRGLLSDYLESDYEDQASMVRLNILSLMKLSHHVGNMMKKQGQGTILNISSIAAYTSGPYMSVYYASKAFVTSFSEGLAEELKPYNIKVKVVAPGPTSTGFEKQAHMENSKAFKLFAPASAYDVALFAYNALDKKRIVYNYGLGVKASNFFCRLLPRIIPRLFIKRLNQNRKD